MRKMSTDSFELILEDIISEEQYKDQQAPT